MHGPFPSPSDPTPAHSLLPLPPGDRRLVRQCQEAITCCRAPGEQVYGSDTCCPQNTKHCSNQAAHGYPQITIPNPAPNIFCGLDRALPRLGVAVALTIQSQVIFEEIGSRSQQQSDLGSHRELPHSTDASFLQLKSHLRGMSLGSCLGELRHENFSSSEIKASKNKQFTKALRLLRERCTSS